MRKMIILSLLAVILTSGSTSFAASWNVADPNHLTGWYWNQTQPAGNPWQYGYTSTNRTTEWFQAPTNPWNGDTYILDATQFGYTYGYTEVQRWIGWAPSVDRATVATYWDSSTFLELGKVYMRGEKNEAAAAVRWTSPVSGMVRIQAEFAGTASDYDLNGHPILIRLDQGGDKTILFSDTVKGFMGCSLPPGQGVPAGPAAGPKPIVSVDEVVTVSAGDVIQFMVTDGGGATLSGVGWGPGVREFVRFNATITSFTCSAPIDSDINGDCVVDFKDFAEMAADWLVDTRIN